jgi:hypothetical protein
LINAEAAAAAWAIESSSGEDCRLASSSGRDCEEGSPTDDGGGGGVTLPPGGGGGGGGLDSSHRVVLLPEDAEKIPDLLDEKNEMGDGGTAKFVAIGYCCCCCDFDPLAPIVDKCFL